MTIGILLDGGCKAIGAFQRRLQGLRVHDRLVGHLGGLLGPLGAQEAFRGDVSGPWQVTVDAPRFAELAEMPDDPIIDIDPEPFGEI